VLAGAAAVATVGKAVADPHRSGVPGPRPVPVASASLVCPSPLARSRVSTALTFASAQIPGLPAGATTGAAGIGPLGRGPFTPQRTLTTTGTADGYRVTKKSSGPVIASATGALAPGLVADQLTGGSEGPYRGLAVQPCGPPVSSAWFLGAASTVGRSSTLYLSNVEDEPALVDVQLWGTAGSIDSASARGIVVKPRSRLTVPVATLAPGQGVLVLRVVAREGRVSPAILDNTVSGQLPRGIEYLPATGARTKVVLPAVLGGAGARELVLLAPRDDATVKVSMLTADGAITPVGLDSLELTAGKVTRVAIDKVTAGQGVGLVLRGSAPLVASVHMVFAGQYNDTAEVAGTPALDQPAAVTGLFAGQSNALVMAAPGAAGKVRMTTYGVSTTKAPAPVVTEVAVPAGTSVTVGVTVPAGSSWAWVLLEPDPSAGKVHVVRRSSVANSAGEMVTTAAVRPLSPIADIPSAVFQVGGDRR
jgi:hypothetical protein